jgi:protein O-mannosyl-transferase
MKKEKIESKHKNQELQADILWNDKSASWPYLVIPPFILSALTAIFYYASLTYSFQFDDVANIKKVFGIRHATLGSTFFTGPRWIATWLNALNYRQGLFDPFYYRLFNITFHIITGILVFYLVLSLLSYLKKTSFLHQYNYAIAYGTAALFLLHPVQTQTISYVIQGRLEGLAALTVIAMALFFVKLTQAQTLIGKIIFSALLFVVGALSCGTKEIAIVSPLLILMIDWFFIAQGSWDSFKKRLLLHAAIFALIFGIYLYFMKPAFFANVFGLKIEARNNIGNLLTENPGEKILPLHFFISQFKVLIHYITMFIWPFNISVEYDWKLVTHFFAPDCILPFLALLAIGGIIAYLLKQNKTSVIGFCALWFFIANAPRSSIIPSSELLTDYKTYLPSFGILFLFSIGIVRLIVLITPHLKSFIPRLNHASAQYLFLTIFAGTAGFFTYERNKVWRSNEEFWHNIIVNAPGKARAYNNLGVALSERGKIKESIPLYKKAIAMDRNYPDPINNLSVAYSMIGNINLAIESMKQAIKIQPRYPEGYNNLASFYIMKKEYDQADKILDIALKLRPHYGKALFNKGKLNLEQGNYEEAFNYFKDACTKADLDNEAGYKIYANAAFTLRKYDDAIDAYTKLLTFDPTSFEYRQKLAQSYQGAKNYQEAITHFAHLMKAQPQNAQILFNLGECYLGMGSPTQALEYFESTKHSNPSMAMLELRIASCFEQLGRIEEAKSILEQYIQKDSVPNNMKTMAQVSLAQLKGKQKSPSNKA